MANGSVVARQADSISTVLTIPSFRSVFFSDNSSVISESIFNISRDKVRLEFGSFSKTCLEV
ncbi:MAG: hypothetical protein ACTSUB_07985 [Candidatus Thorarchaeota archaeon]